MGDLLIFTVVAVAVLALISAALPIILAALGTSVVVVVVMQAVFSWQAGRQAKINSRNQIIARADCQHKKIMSGDTEGGTYGDYPPVRSE